MMRQVANSSGSKNGVRLGAAPTERLNPMRRRWRTATFAGLAALSATTLAIPATAHAAPRTEEKYPVAVGTGGAVSTVDPEATRVGLSVLAKGGNAVDAAVAAAATLGVTEPYSAGIGGGGFFVYYDAKTGVVHTIDGRETAPAAMQSNAFAPDGTPIPFAEAVTSGLSVGVPGTVATWASALSQWGTLSMRKALHGAAEVADRGFVVDETFRQQTAENAERFSAFPATRDLFLPNGQPPAVGSIMRNHDIAQTYRQIGREGSKAFYQGDIGHDLVATAQKPQVDPNSTRVVRPGLMTTADLAAYRAINREPTHSQYRGLDLYSMAPPSSGGSTVGEALNILESFDLGSMDKTQVMHHYLEASALAFADRNRYVGDADQVNVPLETLLSQSFADSRACLITADAVIPRPVAPASLGAAGGCSANKTTAGADHEGISTTHLTTADAWGNVVAYTLTIEQTGGSGIVVPGRGFILNNELTDFNFVDGQGGKDPNLPAPGKRPRSSMSPTIVLQNDKPLLAVGSPGGSTIITTVLQTLINRIDLGMSLPEAITAPRATQRNTAATLAEPNFDTTKLTAIGHKFTPTAEIGAATGIEFLPNGKMQAAAELTRRGGGAAAVVKPSGGRR